jgi:hypothetical protein
MWPLVSMRSGRPIVSGLMMSFCVIIAPAMSGFDRRAHADATAPSDAISIVMDEAKLIKVPERTATIVIGNPLIADASIQAGGLIVLTGKSYGRTNLMALDRAGNALLQTSLVVKGPAEAVVVYRGAARETYSCAPRCEPRNVLGDATPYFNATLNESVTRSSQASGGK